MIDYFRQQQNLLPGEQQHPLPQLDEVALQEASRLAAEIFV
jgi:hypothetical protein